MSGVQTITRVCCAQTLVVLIDQAPVICSVVDAGGNPKISTHKSARTASLSLMESRAALKIYLDINHWYALGEAMAGHPRQHEHKDLLLQLAKCVEQGDLIFPLSAVHYIELSENPRDHHRKEAANVMTLLSRFRTITSTKRILDEELAYALNARFGRPAFPVRVEKFGYGSGFALGHPGQFKLTGGSEEDRSVLEARLGISVAQFEAEINAFAEYQLLKQPSKDLWDQIPGYDPYATRRVADEELKSFNVMLNTLRTNPDIGARPLDAICERQFIFEFLDNYKRALLSAGFSQERYPFHAKEEYTDFLMSLPSRKVAAMIQFYYLKDINRDWTINDLRDIAALSSAIPYCDIVVTDKKAWDVSTHRAHLDTEFGTTILARLPELREHLSTLGLVG
jgi:hypothetical protein